jgi:hypothetical protein
MDVAANHAVPRAPSQARGALPGAHVSLARKANSVLAYARGADSTALPFRDGSSFDLDVVLLHDPLELCLFLGDETRQLLGPACDNLRTLLGEALLDVG